MLPEQKELAIMQAQARLIYALDRCQDNAFYPHALRGWKKAVRRAKRELRRLSR